MGCCRDAALRDCSRACSAWACARARALAGAERRLPGDDPRARRGAMGSEPPCRLGVGAALASAREPLALVHRDDRLGTARPVRSRILLPTREHRAAEFMVVSRRGCWSVATAFAPRCRRPAGSVGHTAGGAHRHARLRTSVQPRAGRRIARAAVRAARLGVVHSVDVALLAQHGLVVGSTASRRTYVAGSIARRAGRARVRASRDLLSFVRCGCVRRGCGDAHALIVAVCEFGSTPGLATSVDPSVPAGLSAIRAYAVARAPRRHAPPARMSTPRALLDHANSAYRSRHPPARRGRRTPGPSASSAGRDSR